MASPRPRPQRGFTLIEVMVSLGILLGCLVGLMRLQIIGISSNAGARMQTQASELAQELAQALERLQPTDPRLALTAGSGITPLATPGAFGHLVDGAGSVATSTATAWDDSNPVPGARRLSEVPPGYERRWTVWGYNASPTSPTATPGALLVAVSVIWREAALPRPREVVVYTQIPQPATLVAGIIANQ
jgi:type IV pilus assembly protein PilV